MIHEIINDLWSTYAPPPELTISEWADKYRVLSPESSAEPGRWMTERAEYLRGIMDVFNDPYVEDIVYISHAQSGKTEVINNAIGYIIDQDPSPVLLVQPTESMANAWSKDRLAPMLRDTPALKNKVKDPRSRNSENTTLHKLFPGGHVTICGSNSPAGLAMRPIRYVFCDEVDRYPTSAGTEGDPVMLAFKRTKNFWNRKRALFSTPTDQNSRIWKSYLETDQRKFYCPCPKCGEKQLLLWKDENGNNRVKWEKDNKGNHHPDTAYYECIKCGAALYDQDRIWMVRNGSWVATAPFNGKAGFWINELYSPWSALSGIVREFLEVKDDPQRFKVWVNTTLAELFEERGESPPWENIFMRRERYEKGVIPKKGLLLVAGADVQKDRIEVEVVAYGRNRESWSVDYRVFSGDVATGGPFKQLDELMNENFPHELGGSTQIRMLAVDSGYETQRVYNWARKYPANKVMAIKGQDSLNAMVGSPKAVDIMIDGKKYKRGVKYWPLGVGLMKSELYGFLRLERDDEGFPPGYCHFPDYDEEYFKQLTAESLKIVNRRFMWNKDRERNEALDCRNYARGAAAVLGMDVFSDDTWKGLEALMKNKIEDKVKQQKKVKKKIMSKGITV